MTASAPLTEALPATLSATDQDRLNRALVASRPTTRGRSTVQR